MVKLRTSNVVIEEEVLGIRLGVGLRVIGERQEDRQGSRYPSSAARLRIHATRACFILFKTVVGMLLDRIIGELYFGSVAVLAAAVCSLFALSFGEYTIRRTLEMMCCSP